MKIRANGILINYEVTGSGKNFTLIHGAGDNSQAWYNQVPVFSQHYSVLTYDVRGFGQTELPPEPRLSREVWVEDLYALLKGLNISETILLGYSMGGSIALQFTLQHPEMVRALVLSNSGVGAVRTEPAMREMEERRQARMEALERAGTPGVVEDMLNLVFSADFRKNNPEAVQRYKEVLLQNDGKGYLRMTREVGMLPPIPASELANLRCPVLIIAGKYDQFSGPDAARAAQQAIRGSQVKIFPSGHCSLVEKPQDYNAAVLKFLSSVGLG